MQQPYDIRKDSRFIFLPEIDDLDLKQRIKHGDIPALDETFSFKNSPLLTELLTDIESDETIIILGASNTRSEK